jgi:soluble lytic murein transglycosylase
MLKSFDSTIEYALAAYNAGPGAVRRWRKRGKVPVEVFVEEIPYEETRNYVKRVLSWKRKLEFLERARREIRQLTRKNAKATTSVAAR